MAEGFNSSVGILVVRTGVRRRVSGGDLQVSIPRSEFWSFGPAQFFATASPIFSFQFLGRNSGRSDLLGLAHLVRADTRFNSSVGILVVRTLARRRARSRKWAFQFLGRNSGRSDYEVIEVLPR